MKISELVLTSYKKNLLDNIFHDEHALLDNENTSKFDMQLESLTLTWAVMDPSREFPTTLKLLLQP